MGTRSSCPYNPSQRPVRACGHTDHADAGYALRGHALAATDAAVRASAVRAPQIWLKPALAQLVTDQR